MSSNARIAEAVYFIQDQSIVHEMHSKNFEQVLSGDQLLTRFAGKLLKGVYVQLNDTLSITSCVLFKIELDELGAPPAQWHIPFTQLCQNGGKNKSFGAGRVKVSTAKQCSVPWHQAKLWDFEEYPNLFDDLTWQVEQNKLSHDFDAKSVGEKELLSFGDKEEGGKDSRESIIEVQTPQFFGKEDLSEDHRGYSQQSQPVGVPSVGGAFAGSASPAPDLMGHSMMHYLSQMQTDYQMQLQNLNVQYKGQMAELTEQCEQRLSSASAEYDQSFQKAAQEVCKLKENLSKLVSKKDSLQDICEAQQNQIAGLKKKLNDNRNALEQKHQFKLEQVAQKYEQIYSEKLDSDHARWQVEMESKEAALQSAQKAVKELQEETTSLRGDKIRLMSGGAYKFFQDLERLGVNFIVFHAGAGHISLSFDELNVYMSDPLAYAANRCGVTQVQYEQWLAHYDHPNCAYPIDEHKTCDCSLVRVESPADYVEGSSNRCSKHQSLMGDWQQPTAKQNSSR